MSLSQEVLSEKPVQVTQSPVDSFFQELSPSSTMEREDYRRYLTDRLNARFKTQEDLKKLEDNIREGVGVPETFKDPLGVERQVLLEVMKKRREELKKSITETIDPRNWSPEAQEFAGTALKVGGGIAAGVLAFKAVKGVASVVFHPIRTTGKVLKWVGSWFDSSVDEGKKAAAKSGGGMLTKLVIGGAVGTAAFFGFKWLKDNGIAGLFGLVNDAKKQLNAVKEKGKEVVDKGKEEAAKLLDAANKRAEVLEKRIGELEGAAKAKASQELAELRGEIKDLKTKASEKITETKDKAESTKEKVIEGVNDPENQQKAKEATESLTESASVEVAQRALALQYDVVDSIDPKLGSPTSLLQGSREILQLCTAAQTSIRMSDWLPCMQKGAPDQAYEALLYKVSVKWNEKTLEEKKSSIKSARLLAGFFGKYKSFMDSSAVAQNQKLEDMTVQGALNAFVQVPSMLGSAGEFVVELAQDFTGLAGSAGSTAYETMQKALDEGLRNTSAHVIDILSEPLSKYLDVDDKSDPLSREDRLKVCAKAISFFEKKNHVTLSEIESAMSADKIPTNSPEGKMILGVAKELKKPEFLNKIEKCLFLEENETSDEAKELREKIKSLFADGRLNIKDALQAYYLLQDDKIPLPLLSAKMVCVLNNNGSQHLVRNRLIRFSSLAFSTVTRAGFSAAEWAATLKLTPEQQTELSNVGRYLKEKGTDKLLDAWDLATSLSKEHPVLATTLGASVLYTYILTPIAGVAAISSKIHHTFLERKISKFLSLTSQDAVKLGVTDDALKAAQNSIRTLRDGMRSEGFHWIGHVGRSLKNQNKVANALKSSGVVADQLAEPASRALKPLQKIVKPIQDTANKLRQTPEVLKAFEKVQELIRAARSAKDSAQVVKLLSHPAVRKAAACGVKAAQAFSRVGTLLSKAKYVGKALPYIGVLIDAAMVGMNRYEIAQAKKTGNLALVQTLETKENGLLIQGGVGLSTLFMSGPHALLFGAPVVAAGLYTNEVYDAVINWERTSTDWMRFSEDELRERLNKLTYNYNTVGHRAAYGDSRITRIRKWFTMDQKDIDAEDDAKWKAVEEVNKNERREILMAYFFKKYPTAPMNGEDKNAFVQRQAAAMRDRLNYIEKMTKGTLVTANMGDPFYDSVENYSKVQSLARVLPADQKNGFSYTWDGQEKKLDLTTLQYVTDPHHKNDRSMELLKTLSQYKNEVLPQFEALQDLESIPYDQEISAEE